MAKSANNKPRTRRTKQDEGGGRQIQDKFQEQREANINTSPLKPLNELQSEYIRLLREKDMIIATGYAGTSKTYIPTVMACDEFRVGNIDKIYLTRPNISNSKSLGYFGGSLEEKCANWLGPVLSILFERLGRGAVECAIKNGNISFVPLEVIKGWSFKDAWVICDEAEDITTEEAKKIVTRIGNDCKLVLAGDLSQSELKDRSGLKTLLEMTEETPQLEPYVGMVDFNRFSDIVRSDICREWIMAFHRKEIKDKEKLF